MYPWPIGDFDNAMDEALDIAMDYLERTEQAVKFIEVQRAAAMAIVTALRLSSPTSQSKPWNETRNRI
jgi:hypothetical protein